MPLRVLTVIASPADAPPLDPASAWKAIEGSLEPVVALGQLVVERLAEPTEAALKARLAGAPVDVLHFIGHGRAQQAAKYATLAFHAADGRARNLTVQYLGTLLKAQPSLRLLVLQVGASDERFEGARDVPVDAGPEAIVTTARFAPPLQALFVRRFYGLLAAGASVEEAVAQALDALATSGANVGADGIALRGAGRLTRFGATPQASPATAPEPVVARAPQAPDPTAADAAASARREHARCELERKRLAGAFDVFLCHSRADKPAVKRIAQQLKEHGVLPWLDEWELPPGQPWQPLLERQISSIKSAAVFVGAGGVGPWQEQELYGLLREFVSRRSPVIPVLLMSAPEQPKLPVFLGAMTWVDFRKTEPDPLAQLVWGITGKRDEIP